MKLTVFAAFLTLCIAAAQTPAQDRADPSSTLIAFANAVATGDFNNVVPFVEGAQTDPRFGYDKDLLAAAGLSTGKWTLEHMKSEVTDQEATLECDLTIDTGTPQPAIHQVVHLHKAGDQWFVEPNPTYSPMAVPANDSSRILSDMAAICRYPTLYVRQTMSRLYVCLYNIRDLGGLVLSAAKGKNGQIPCDSSSWSSFVDSLPNGKVLCHCPLDDNNTEYAFNEELNGKSLADIRDPANTVLLYEGASKKLQYRHLGRAAVVFCDGHAKMVDSKEAPKLNWKLSPHV